MRCQNRGIVGELHPRNWPPRCFNEAGGQGLDADEGRRPRQRYSGKNRSRRLQWPLKGTARIAAYTEACNKVSGVYDRCSTARDAGGGPGQTERRRADRQRSAETGVQYVGFVRPQILSEYASSLRGGLFLYRSGHQNYELVPAFPEQNYATIIHRDHMLRSRKTCDGFLAHDHRMAWRSRFVTGWCVCTKRCSVGGTDSSVVLPFWTSYLLRVTVGGDLVTTVASTRCSRRWPEPTSRFGCVPVRQTWLFIVWSTVLSVSRR